MEFSRRRFLRYANAIGMSAAASASIGATLSAFQTANAANISGYKALVCLFFLGGMDSHDTLLPYDQDSYDQFAEIRSELFSRHNGARDRDRLLPLTPENASGFGGRQFALTEDFAAIHQLIQSGDAAVIGNVGPLLQPTDLDLYRTSKNLVPPRLFSHNDQQSTWLSNKVEGAQLGWGGRIADASIEAGANVNEVFSTISTVSGYDAFLTGNRATPYQIGSSGTEDYDRLSYYERRRERNEQTEQAYQLFRKHMAAEGYLSSHYLEQDVAAVLKSALNNNELYSTAAENLPDLPVAFPTDRLGQQLNTVARTIQMRSILQMNRQVFFVAIGGFDTHNSQVNDLPPLHRSIDASVAAFYQNMVSLGLGGDVTMFTASDFGRTLAVNGDGTDHAWGAHHFVIGNSVRGNRIYGSIPPHHFDHEWDLGRGRFIPSVSVEQYAEPMARWFGLSTSEIAAALPNYANFSSEPSLDFMI